MASASSNSLFYGKTILGPMVRVCDLGFRTMCDDCGADVIFTEEIVAAKLSTCRREVRRYPCVDEDIIEYVTYDEFKNKIKRAVVLSLLSDREKHAPVVLQLGAASGVVAAKAALRCSRDITAIDVNMGCPKTFSISNGFGAALMRRPETAGSILKELHASVNSASEVSDRNGRRIPISFKTRLKGNDPSETVEMLREILTAAGHQPTDPVVHAITIHARLREQRSETAALYSIAASVTRACREDSFFHGICFVLNGSIESRADGVAKCQLYSFDAAMMARSALCDPTQFAKPSSSSDAPPQVLDEAHYWNVMKKLLIMSIRFRKDFKNYKYHLTRVFPEVPLLKPHMHHVQERLRSYEDCYPFFKLTEEERAEAVVCRRDLELIDEMPPAEECHIAQKRARVEEEEKEQKQKIL